MLYKDLTIQHKDLTRRHYYLTSEGRNMQPSINTDVCIFDEQQNYVQNVKIYPCSILNLAINLYAKHIHCNKQIPQIFKKF